MSATLPTVYLCGLDSIGFIVPCPSGVVYQNQTGGMTALQSRCEGVFIPYEDADRDFGVTDALERYFAGPKWKCWCSGPIDEDTAIAVEEIMWRVPGLQTVVVDRARLSEAMEAWIPVRLGPEIGYWEGLEGRSAILTWPNCE